ncbi:Speckle-type POZ protein B [Araneus ventricosus]|uniref:Speckle-type POZ protein B n=1 Tax=Araneus ventricosus TaxID=182803 RepID=A0A4Y2IGT1_ARAVE|nr:Speckle-type POZ protein B [Araneus ventricosus]
MAGTASNDEERRPPFIFVWRIECVPRDWACKSPEFTLRSIGMTKWRMSLFFTSLDSPSSFWIQRMQDGGPDSVEIQFELSLLYTNRSSPIRSSGRFKKNDYSKDLIFPEIDTILDERRVEVCPKYPLSVRCRIWSKATKISKCELKLIPDSPIWNRVADCKFADYSDSKTVHMKKRETHYDKLNVTAACPFKEVFNKCKDNEILSDVCLRAGNKSFPVHKLILSSRSPVFKAMFTSGMREKTSKCIDIPDLDADTLNRLLLYIYKDEVQKLTWEIAANLFEAADKYELLTLKEKCSCFLQSNLSKSNVCKILVLADMHYDGSLRNSVQKFMLNNPEIVYCDVWKVFKQNHSKLALETTEQIIFRTKTLHFLL